MHSNAPSLSAPGIKTWGDKIHPAVTTLLLPCGNHVFLPLQLLDRDLSAYGNSASDVGSGVRLHPAGVDGPLPSRPVGIAVPGHLTLLVFVFPWTFGTWVVQKGLSMLKQSDQRSCNLLPALPC